MAGTPVEAVQYTENGHNFDIARFASNSRTPTITVTLPSTPISTVNVYPARYYPSGSVTVSSDKHTLTFRMSATAALNEAIVMVNGDSTNAAGQPYLAVINDPLEDPAQRPDTTSAPDGSGVNLQTGVLNFQEFANSYLAAHPNSAAQTAPAATTSSMAGRTVDGTAIPAGQQTSAGSLVSATSVNVRYPNERVMAADDDTYALQAALRTIEDHPTQLNTLYFPNGTYLWSGLLVNGLDGSRLKGGKLKIYTDEGALLRNRIQAYMEAFEPEIAIVNSNNIEIDGRGVFDGNGVANYNASSSGDLHDAYRSQHQGGVMVMHSSNVTFNDTYERNAKQWNWETHSANDVIYTNIKALTPTGSPGSTARTSRAARTSPPTASSPSATTTHSPPATTTPATSSHRSPPASGTTSTSAPPAPTSRATSTRWAPTTPSPASWASTPTTGTPRTRRTSRSATR
ncbi:hypothetical protein ACFQZC_37155 [Streptacidiphilus monticola]